jgi:hypothetical protein
VRFQPSPYSSPSSYGYDEDAYAAQQMLTTYRSGMDVGDGYGFIDALVAAAAGATTAIVGAVNAGKERQHDVEMARQERKTLDKQAELARIEAELAAFEAQRATAEQAGMVAMASWVGGGLLTVGLLGIGVYAASKARR